ncbi:MAG: hypothetical protein ACRCT8_01485 [Lacipirellulaceae bacterium]
MSNLPNSRRRVLRVLLGCWLALAATVAPGQSEFAPAPAAAPVAAAAVPASTPALAPAPIFWGRHGLVVPYRWSGKGAAQSASEVVLYVSQDRGQHWQKVASAAPHVRSFHYQAPADGEFAFAIRTYDRAGGFQPPGPVRPEMRVIVDTALPEVTRFEATDDGVAVRVTLAARDRVALDPSSVRLYSQADGRGGWSPVSMELVGGRGDIELEARALWAPPADAQRVVLRVAIVDRAGNRAESSCVAQSAAPSDPRLQSNPYVAAAPPTPWAPLSTADPTSHAIEAPLTGGAPQPTAPQLGSPWGMSLSVVAPPSALAVARDPFASGNGPTLPASSSDASPAPPLMAGAEIGSGSATGGGPSDTAGVVPVTSGQQSGWRSDVLARAEGPIEPQAWPADAARRLPLVSAAAPIDSPVSRLPVGSSPPVARGAEPAEGRSGPFSTASFGDRPNESQARLQDGAPGPNHANPWGNRDSLWGDAARTTPPREAQRGEQSPWGDFGRPTLARSVNSTEFELDYELTQTGRWGVASVELWGTEDGGATWRRFAIDSDRQSPIHVTVPGEGNYGFRVLVESVGGLEAERPRGGDKPEVQVRVDLAAPRVTLARVEQGQGYFADQLRIDWRVEEEHATRAPIDLYYSNRASGPWLPVATALDDSGSHTWRLQRHLPQRLYLRLEARDAAGNVGSATTPEPITLELAQAAANLSGVRPVGP